jgi:hypothetical protein
MNGRKWNGPARYLNGRKLRGRRRRGKFNHINKATHFNVKVRYRAVVIGRAFLSAFDRRGRKVRRILVFRFDIFEIDGWTATRKPSGINMNALFVPAIFRCLVILCRRKLFFLPLIVISLPLEVTKQMVVVGGG